MMFAIHLGHPYGESSRLVIGAYDTEAVTRRGTKWESQDDVVRKDKTKDGIFWMEINSDRHW